MKPPDRTMVAGAGRSRGLDSARRASGIGARRRPWAPTADRDRVARAAGAAGAGPQSHAQSATPSNDPGPTPPRTGNQDQRDGPLLLALGLAPRASAADQLSYLFNRSPALLRRTLPVKQDSKSRLPSWLRFSLKCPKRRLEPLVHNRIYDRFRGRRSKGRLRWRGSERPRRIGGRVWRR